MTFDLSRPNFARFTIGLSFFDYKVGKSVANLGFPFGRGNVTGRVGVRGLSHC